MMNDTSRLDGQLDEELPQNVVYLDTHPQDSLARETPHGAEQDESQTADIQNQEATTLITDDRYSAQSQLHGTLHDKTPQGVTDRISSPSKQRRILEVGQSWYSELGSLILGLASFVAIIVILRKYDGNLQPNWSHGITLNAVVAVLATSLRACLAFIIEEGKSNEIYA